MNNVVEIIMKYVDIVKTFGLTSVQENELNKYIDMKIAEKIDSMRH